MNERAEHLKRLLALEAHVEGGHYRRIYESTSSVAFGDEQRKRAMATSIYYLLRAGEISQWHRIDADEIWHWYEGEPIEMLRFDPRGQQLTRHRLGPVSSDSAPVFVVPAGCWQAARPLGEYALVGCTVAPGYEWRGFSTLAAESEVTDMLRALDPDLLALT
ncbi:MAG: cupin domain-containing protein [Dokdonella sp.]